MNAIVRPAAPILIEPALLRTKLVSGLLPPVEDAGFWPLIFYEERIASDGSKERLVVTRLGASRVGVEQMLRAMQAAVGN